MDVCTNYCALGDCFTSIYALKAVRSLGTCGSLIFSSLL